MVVDHQALEFMFMKAQTTGRLARLLALITEFKMEVLYRRGKKHQNADPVSRRRVVNEMEEGQEVEMIEECQKRNILFCKHIKIFLSKYYPGLGIPKSAGETKCTSLEEENWTGLNGATVLPVGLESRNAEVEPERADVLEYLVNGTVQNVKCYMKIRKIS